MTSLYLIIIIAAVVFFFAAVFIYIRRKKAHLKRIELIEGISNEVDSAFIEISSYYKFGHYITESERKYLLDKYSDLLIRTIGIIFSKELKESPHKDKIDRFYKSMTETDKHKKSNNEHFIDNQLTIYSQYFDSVLAYPLDGQQREAIVSLEDNVLVISSAGSGKTMTTVGKVRYLIDVQKVDPEKILLITFTRKAAESLSERLGEKKIKCRTFHKLALDIISEATGEKPSIVNPDFPIQVYHSLIEKNQSFRMAVADYVIASRYYSKDQFDYDSMESYITDRQKYGIHAYYTDMDGKPVFCKSDQEDQICDYLGSRGIKFRYEEPYELQVKDQDHRQYTPDFSIYFTDESGQNKRIYLEHFAVNEKGKCPSFFSYEDETKYLEGMEWKRSLHSVKGTTLIETTSADFHRNNVFDILEKQLKDCGVPIAFVESAKVSRELLKQEENILNMLTAFIFLMKSRGLTVPAILSQATGEKEFYIIRDIVSPFVNEYSRMEIDKDENDFTDIIIQATELCNNGHRPDYDYILVDEFQDISADRYRFLQSLRRKMPLTKLFCVGDDWQSIYRFAGSDMALFRQFEEYFGFTKKCYMETTYRFGEPAIKQSSDFILSNPGQETKNVRPFNSEAVTKLDFISTPESPVEISSIIRKISESVPDDKEIMLLGRYSFDVNILKDTCVDVHATKGGTYITCGERKINYLTVHQSKGLECDYVILLNCNGGRFGFPADISDSPVLKYVLSEPEQYAFGEERRVFYVGITRAKLHTWVLYNANNPSPFVREFNGQEKISPVSFEKKESIPDPSRCPKCKCGRVYLIKKGVAVNGNPYSVYSCSNRKFGCNYYETVFMNLNAHRYKRPYNNKNY